jgi:hypothetical protein
VCLLSDLVDGVVGKVVAERPRAAVCADAILLPFVQPLMDLDQELVEVHPALAIARGAREEGVHQH